MSGDDALGGVRGEEADAVLRLQRFYVGRTEPHRYLHGDGIIGTSKEQGGGQTTALRNHRIPQPDSNCIDVYSPISFNSMLLKQIGVLQCLFISHTVSV